MSTQSAAVYEAPSKQEIAKATGIALAVALVIFFTTVLPAEYGMDPLHTGRAFGLMSLARSAPASGGGAPAETRAYQKTAIAESQPAAAGEAPVITGVFVSEPSHYKIDSRELKLDVGQGMEIKYHMQQGSSMVYSWTASKNIQFEFHGEPDVKPAGSAPDYYESYEKNDVDGKNQSNGTFTAPSTGIEGWFWDNESEGIKLFPGLFAAVGQATRRVGLSMGVGALVLIAGTPLLIFSILLVLAGAGAGFAALMLYIPVLYASQLFVGAWIGEKVLSASAASHIGQLAVGLLILRLLGMIPFLGSFVWIAAFLWGAGAIFVALWTRTRLTSLPPALA